MIPQKITEIELEELYKFTRKHFVEHYDVQTELVDHLANDIEQLWQEKPCLSFEEARVISFKKFGVFGFLEVVESQSKAMSRKYYKIMFSILKDFFRLPQILITLAVFGVVFGALTRFSSHQSYTITALFLLVILVMIVRLFELRNIKKRRRKSSGKKWMFEEMILNTGGFASFSYLPLQFISTSDGSHGVYWMVFMSSFFTVFMIVNYIVAFIIPSKMEELLAAQYPAYKIKS